MATPKGIGEWPSPITSELITSKSLKLASPSIHGHHLLWLEGRPAEAGRVVLVRSKLGSGAAAEDLTPGVDSGLYVRTTVHEYGGGDYTVSPDGTVFFSNFKDQCVYKQPLSGSTAPSPLTAEGQGLRFADYVYDAHHNRVIAVCEQHKGEHDVINTVVAIDPESGALTTLASGHDFYTNPRPSPDGTQLAFVAWDFPNMPWDGTGLYVSRLSTNGAVEATPHLVAGGADEAVQQPVWSHDGSHLFFITDASGWWNIAVWHAGKVRPVTSLSADFGWPLWVFGISTWSLLDDHHILALYNDPKEAGITLAVIDVSTGSQHKVETGFTSYGSPTKLEVVPKAGGGYHIAAVAAGATDSPRVTVLTVDSIPALKASKSKDWVTIRSSTDLPVPLDGYLSTPRAIEYPTEHGKTAHLIFYPPVNKDVRLPDGQLPPLLVKSHGGPTSAANVQLSLLINYFTSRGFAVADVNYGGSTGYGREYRNRLRGTWGITDVNDCANAAKYLASQGLVDAKRMCISGGSAGGYTTLACLAFRDVFSAGASLYGVADLGLLAADTHKFESRYLDLLIGPWPAAKDVYDARSPIKHVEGFKSPIIFFQGDEDKVVPPEQAIIMHDAVRARGVPTALVMFKGEQHGFRQASSIRVALDGELWFYGKALGFHASMPADLPPITIDNLP